MNINMRLKFYQLMLSVTEKHYFKSANIIIVNSRIHLNIRLMVWHKIFAV